MLISCCLVNYMMKHDFNLFPFRTKTCFEISNREIKHAIISCMLHLLLLIELLLHIIF